MLHWPRLTQARRGVGILLITSPPPTTYMCAHTLRIRLTVKLHQVTRSLVTLLSDCVPRMVIPQKLCPCPARHHPQSAKGYQTCLKFSCCNFRSVFNLYFALYRHSALSLHWSYSSTNPDLFYSMKVGWDWHRNQYPDFLQLFVAIKKNLKNPSPQWTYIRADYYYLCISTLNCKSALS